VAAPGPGHQGEPVLAGDQRGGASNAPAVTAEANTHGDTEPSTGHRPADTDPAATIAATASANPDPAGAGSTASTPASTSTPVNTARHPAARTANRRSHPRTVSAGRDSHRAIRRWPAPAAFAAKAAPTTSARSALRDNALTGSSTCVTPQPRQRARRGRHRATAPPRPRTARATPNPHRASRPPHPGQHRSPAASRRSTETGWSSTVSTAPPSATHGPPGPCRKDHREGRYMSLDRHGVVADGRTLLTL